MPSRVRRAQVAAEWVLRAAALALLGWLLALSLWPRPAAHVEGARGEALAAALPRWTLSAPDSLRVALAAAPPPVERDWLRALAASGTAVAWSPLDGGPRPLALAAERDADPAAGATLRVAAARGARITVADRAGVIDTVVVESAGGVLSARAHGPVVAVMGAERASGALADSALLRPLLVLARAGWEPKFVIAALEERGWRIDARLAVAPGTAVTQGAPGAIDTARYAAVVALDSVAVREAAALARYVRAGGGLVLGPEAAMIPTLAALSPGRPDAPVRLAAPEASPAADSAARPVRAFRPLGALRSDAVPLERRAGRVVVAARRAELGRVLLTGYDETWRWRMAGGERGAHAHRAWWGRALAAVARAPEAPAPNPQPPVPVLDPAPLAHLYDALGPPASSDSPMPEPARDPRPAIALALLAALLAEWASRRLRGGR